MIQNQLISVGYHTPEQVLERSRHLPGMTFRDVMNLGIASEGVERTYNSRRYKGGLGNLLEEGLQPRQRQVRGLLRQAEDRVLLRVQLVRDHNRGVRQDARRIPEMVS